MKREHTQYGTPVHQSSLAQSCCPYVNSSSYIIHPHSPDTLANNNNVVILFPTICPASSCSLAYPLSYSQSYHLSLSMSHTISHLLPYNPLRLSSHPSLLCPWLSSSPNPEGMCGARHRQIWASRLFLYSCFQVYDCFSFWPPYTLYWEQNHTLRQARPALSCLRSPHFLEDGVSMSKLPLEKSTQMTAVYTVHTGTHAIYVLHLLNKAGLIY